MWSTPFSSFTWTQISSHSLFGIVKKEQNVTVLWSNRSLQTNHERLKQTTSVLIHTCSVSKNAFYTSVYNKVLSGVYIRLQKDF